MTTRASRTKRGRSSGGECVWEGGEGERGVSAFFSKSLQQGCDPARPPCALHSYLIGGSFEPLTFCFPFPFPHPSLQQEILSRRRSGTWKKDVEERRTKVSRYLRDPTFKKEVDKERSARFKATQEAEAKQREEEAKKGVINVPFFTVPFNIPEYDG